MKTITKEYRLYPFEELSDDAKTKALKDWADSNTFPFLQDDLREYCHEALEEAGYMHGEITPLFDLNETQGSGLMFEGTVWNRERTRIYSIRHNGGKYYNEESARIECRDESGKWQDAGDFVETYRQICREVRDRGRDQIAYENSMENYEGLCEGDDIIFLEDGTRFEE